MTTSPGPSKNDTIPNSTVPVGSEAAWRDRKRYLWLLGLVMPTLGVLIVATYALLGWHWVLWAGPIVILGVVPAIDLSTGLDRSNPPDDMIEALEKDKYYRWITFAYLPIQYVALVAVCAMIAGVNPIAWVAELVGVADWLAAHVSPDLVRDFDLTTLDKIAVAISVGCIGGIGINTAHELGHKREEHERWLSKIALAQSGYGHFYIEHNRGHHVRVATPEDPASSRLGENFYEFWPRTVVGSLRSAWRLEKRRYARKDTHPFHLGNDVLNAWLMSAVLFGGLIALFGWQVAPYLAIQAVVGFSLLEVVNYLEHYGMLRQKVGVGERQRYERVDPSHSWNSNNIATNVLLYHLQRHSDHHANPTRRYQTLRDFEESPVLPTGYAGMILLALVPPLWRRVMDPRVVAHYGGDVSLANLHPRTRERYLARYPAAAAVAPLGEDRATASLDATPVADEVLAARCPGCGYTYEVEAGNELEGFAAGTAWSEIPDDWCCPDCGVREKVDFVPLDPALDAPAPSSPGATEWRPETPRG
ncbi:alkane 1-monooxygenase [Nocardioides sp. GY 10113]|uniref:fatty acid desaturase n=1 Tax=Nocardioides sp. GY 10113 TaxID=2569761 RepID=UPI0010A7A0F2|nr:fatty acid desaturase [Nocardioides sp. GY 10113]TIC89149.1 alkane 1-monooxygenase [Nocardioides sp. GY 10113]